MRFLTDMEISPKTTAFLRGFGHEAVHLSEEGLQHLEDGAVLVKAREEGRILLTHDLDFGELVAASGAQLPSIIVFRLRNMRPERINYYFQRIMEEHGKVLKEGVIISVNEGQVRARLLPLRARE